MEVAEVRSLGPRNRSLGSNGLAIGATKEETQQVSAPGFCRRR